MVKKGFCQMSLLIVLSAVLFISGCGADSETTSTPDTSAPTAPPSVTAVAASYEKVRITWDAATDNVGVAGYKIYRDNNTLPLASLTTPTTFYYDTTCVPETKYTYAVAATDAAGNISALSSAVDATTMLADNVDGGKPTAPNTLNAVKTGANEITLTWSASTDGVGVAGYNIYRATSQNGTPVLVATTTSQTYIDTGRTAGTYYYVVTAFDGAQNESTNSIQESETLL